MKTIIGILIFGIGLITVGCKEENIEKQKAEDEIIYKSVDRSLNEIGGEIVQIPYDERLKFRFSIVNVKALNDQWEQGNTDTLAVDMQTNDAEILDDSEYGYLNALNKDANISANSGFWNQRTEPEGYLLSTTWGAEFKGAGDKYFGFRLKKGSDYIYGWFLVNCSEKSDHLEIKEYAYNKTAGNIIKAGQK